MSESRHVRITPAQHRVLAELLKDGATNPQIAKRLFVTVNTVKSHLQFLYAATGIHDRTGLVLAAATGRLTFTWTCDLCREDDGAHRPWCREGRRAG